jgi:uncharacterized protein (TIGR02145 family)
MNYYNGTAWITIAPTANDGAHFTMTAGVPSWAGGTPPVIPTVESSTGRTWMDRNLGATRVATSFDDVESYGNLYQWGRGNDGHEKRESAVTNGPVDFGSEGSNFIISELGDFDWLNTPDDTRWNGDTKGIHDPCPTGFRVPTESEFEAERSIYNTSNGYTENDISGAFNSILKLPAAGFRYSYGTIDYEGFIYAGAPSGGSYYWTSTVRGAESRAISHGNNSSKMRNIYRSHALPVRCIKEE